MKIYTIFLPVLLLTSITLIGFNYNSSQETSEDIYELSSFTSSTVSASSLYQGNPIKYYAQSCVDENGCCGIKCIIGNWEQCCAGTTCICLTTADADELAGIYDWAELDEILWLNIDSATLNQYESKNVLANYITFCEE